MRDVEKTSLQHETNSRRTRRRRRGRTLYILMIVVLAVAAIVTLSLTVLFNIQTIRVTGYADNYRAEDIVAATGIEVGDNMFRLDTEAARQRALDSLIYVESIEIDRQFPNTVEIQVQKCTPAYNVVYEFGTLVVSEHGKILEDTMYPPEGLVKITGYTPKETTPGTQIAAEEERYDKVFDAFRELIYQGGLGAPIVAVDMSDFNDIMVNFDNRITFDMGNWSEIGYKINFAEQVIAEQPADKEGYIIMVGTNQCSFRNKADYEATRRAVKAAAEPTDPTDESSETDEDGEDETTEAPEDEGADPDENLDD
ncbi:MAG: FtsQ-type POTRA domain-containing protein [Oscillospiraceae bacterium]|nr:FtsQ-type POTRA domain-containing protein [Oscillospiraceae bacterium]